MSDPTRRHLTEKEFQDILRRIDNSTKIRAEQLEQITKKTYILLSTENIERVADLTGRTLDEVTSVLREAEQMECSVAIWFEFGEWKQIFANRFYDVADTMKRYFDREPE